MLNFKPSPLLKRVFVFSLCFFLFFFVFSRPIVVSANSATMINIASNYQDVIQVAPYLLPIILILIAVGWWWEYSEDLADKAMDIYNNGSVSLRNWANDVAQQIIDGTSAFKLTKTAANEINKQLGSNNQISEDKKYIMLPPDLLSLRTADPDDILVSDVLSAVEDGNELTQETNSILNKIRVFLGSLGLNLETTINSSTSSIRRFMDVINNNMMDYINDVVQEVYNVRQSLSGRLDELNNTLSSKLDSVDTKLHTINQNFLNKIAGISQQIKNLSDSLIYRVNNIMTYIDALPQDIASALKSNFSSLQQTLERIEVKVGELTDVGTVTKPNIEVVAGTQTIVVSDYATMGQAFSAKMGWIPQIFDFLAELRSRLNSGTAPKVAIDLSDAEGSYNYGGKVYVLDMSWYARYKPSVDTFLSGVMWICFGWAIYKRIPDIISGVGLTVENATETRGHVWADRAEREASLSYRQERRSDYYAKKNNKGG